MCLCARIPTLQNRTGLQILQHSGERRHPLGTARLLKLGLQQVDLHVLFSNHADGTCPPVALPPGSGLLYPSPDARDLASLPPGEAPAHLVVIDGTWDQAHRVYRDNAWIRALPHYRLHPDAPSNYRIRREPRFECLSTLEAVAIAIRILEPDLDGVDALVGAFEEMIDDQIRAAALAARPGRGIVVTPPPRPAPRPTFLPDERVIVAYAEPVAQAPNSHALRDLLHLTAVALDTGAVFDALIRHDEPPDAYHLGRLRLDASALDAAVPLDDALAAFARFCGPAPALASWHLCTHRLLETLDPVCARHVLLKGEWANRTRTRVPALDDVVRGLGLASAPLAVRGRAGAQLTLAMAVARHLRGEAPGGAP
jgi:DTW domain-containing protein YfiP